MEKYWKGEKIRINSQSMKEAGRSSNYNMTTGFSYSDQLSDSDLELSAEEIVHEILAKQFSQVQSSRNLVSGTLDCLIEVCELLSKEKGNELKSQLQKLSAKRTSKMIRHNVFGQVVNGNSEVDLFHLIQNIDIIHFDKIRYLECLYNCFHFSYFRQ